METEKPYAYEMERLRTANVKLTLALESAVAVIEQLLAAKRSFVSADNTLAFAKATLRDNKK